MVENEFENFDSFCNVLDLFRSYGFVKTIGGGF